MSVDIDTFNARWLQAWTDKDVPGLLGFYAPDVVYRDPQTADGITGREALGAYLTGLFAATPPMRYTPHEVWATHNGFCGRWHCAISPPGGETSHLRGFDLVVLKDDLILLNEVYVHPLAGPPAS